MGTIGFIFYPETGHLRPSLKMAHALMSRGHRVCYLGLPDFEDIIRARGFEFIAVFETLCPKGFLARWAQRKEDSFSVFFQEVQKAGKLGRPFRDLQEKVERLDPDLLIVDCLLPDVALSAHLKGLPTALLNVMLYYDSWEETVSYRALAALPEIVLCPVEFEFPRASHRVGRYYVEASIDLRQEDVSFPWDRLDPEKPLLYCSFGSQSHLYEHSLSLFQMVIDAMAVKQEWQSVIATGVHVSIERLPSIPSNVLIADWAPQSQILRRAAIMISHGGLNTIKECILMGVPMIVFPMGREQSMNAARVTYHGLGLRSNPQDVSVKRILSLIDTIETNPSFRRRTEHMGRRFRQLEEAGLGVSLIETLLAPRPMSVGPPFVRDTGPSAVH